MDKDYSYKHQAIPGNSLVIKDYPHTTSTDWENIPDSNFEVEAEGYLQGAIEYIQSQNDITVSWIRLVIDLINLESGENESRIHEVGQYLGTTGWLILTIPLYLELKSLHKVKFTLQWKVNSVGRVEISQKPEFWHKTYKY